MSDFRSLPSVNELAGIQQLQEFPERVRIIAAQGALQVVRESIDNRIEFDLNNLVVKIAHEMTKVSLRKVFNFTGVILHTGLGRAPLESNYDAWGYINLEFDLETGKRGDRQNHVRKLLCDLTGSEDALVVNNAAAAVFLTLSALCKGKQVLLSRGQSVEIGGSFRMPEIVKASGCKLIDVGATNKTYASDYTNAITPSTAAILRCHPSNFQITGFTHEPTTKELAEEAQKANVLMINDQGNGALVDFNQYGIHGIETLPQSVAAGASITIASGDKLLGGPQCGLILGSKALLAKIAKHAIARTVRIDKVSLSCLEQTLRCYRYQTLGEIQLHKILRFSAEEIYDICQKIAPEEAEVKETLTELGSGSGSGHGVKSYALVLRTPKPNQLLKELRQHRIIGRIQDKAVWLDPRTEADFLSDRSMTIEGAEKQMPPFKDMFCETFRERLTKAWEKWK